jgi:DNA-binding transcriptional LysR family regulator
VSALAEARRISVALLEGRWETSAAYTAFVVDVHTRKLRYFVAVADDLHFSRAAARLFVAQQALSKQIRELEELVGTQLFERTSRKVELTPAGAAFLVQARAVLAALDGGVHDAWRARGIEIATLRLGFGIGAALELTATILAEFNEQHSETRLELREYPFTEPSAGLADGSSDVAFVRLPIGCDEIDFEPIFREPVVVALSARHRFADRSSVTAAELLDEPLAIGRSTDAVWQGFWSLDAFRDGKPPPSITYTNSQTEELEVVAAGLACSITGAAASRYVRHPNVHYIPIEDVPPSMLALAWRRDARTPAVERFRAVTMAVRDRETEIVRSIEQASTAG